MITNEYINRAIDYILNHIDEEITVEDISNYCCFSRYYFSRIFKMETGESIYEFIKRVRMERSAFRLKVEKDRSITDIGSAYGYSSSNYSSAFKKHHNMPPYKFRRSIVHKSMMNPVFRNTQTELLTWQECSEKISVEMFEDCTVIFERYKGSYGDLSVHWGAFLDKYKEYITERTRILERSYDDPAITLPDKCLCDICIDAPAGCTLENICTIKGGRFAVYHFSGPVEHIYSAYQNLFSVWLPQSKYKIDDSYGFEIYKKTDCGSMHMDIDICIPVK